MTMLENAPADTSEDTEDRSAPRLSPTQLRTFDDLLAIGGDRPFAPAGLAERLIRVIDDGTRDAMERWTERSLWVGKAMVATAHRCEGKLLADRLTARTSGVTAPTATGIVVHRAIQLAHTHQGRAPEEYVRLAVAGACTEEDFSAFWDAAPEHIQSDLMVTATSRVVGFLDAFPPIAANWVPRFEENIQVKVGRVTLSARPDLLLGRPRADGRQTMFICDVKSGELRPDHIDEARFYALVAAMRFGTPPFRSAVFSLSSGEWTEPDIDERVLTAAAEMVVDAVVKSVAVLTEQRAPQLEAGRHCVWCPARDTCPAFTAWDEAGRPEPAVEPIAYTAALLTRRAGGSQQAAPPAGADPDTDTAQVQEPALFEMPATAKRQSQPLRAPTPAAASAPPAAPPAATVEQSGPNPWALD